jgi:hypothetical protein
LKHSGSFGDRRQVDSEARWIWADTGVEGCTGKSDCSHALEDACCRYTTSGSMRINCNAARTRCETHGVTSS